MLRALQILEPNLAVLGAHSGGMRPDVETAASTV